MKKKIKIIIADDHPVIRRGLGMVINSEKNLEIIGEAENGDVVLKLLETVQPDIVILDIDMPIRDGIETAKILNISYPNIKVVFLSMHKDKEILESLKALNVKGYVLKDDAVMEIVECLNNVAVGEEFTSPVILEILHNRSKIKTFEPVLTFNSTILSPTELRILQRIGDSKTNREIAEELFISVRTVENHRFNICSKLKIRGNHALLKFALENKVSIFLNNNNN